MDLLSSNLEQKIFEIKRNNLEKKVFQSLDISKLRDAMVWERITRLSNFWEDKSVNTIVAQSLEKCIGNWCAGLYGENRAFAFVLCGKSSSREKRGGEIECWFGMSGLGTGHEAHGALQAELAAVMPDARFMNSADYSANQKQYPVYFSEKLPFAALMTGTPSPKAIGETHEIKGVQIERLCRAFNGTDWMYLVFAFPYPRSDVQKDIMDFSNEIKNIRMQFLQNGTVIGQGNKTAEEYIELLEKKLERWKVGNATGMWTTWRFLYAPSREILKAGESMLLSAYSGEASLPDPCRTHRIGENTDNSLLRIDQPGLIPPITSLELSALVCPPLEEYAGFEIVPVTRFGVETNQHFAPQDNPLPLGAIQDRGRANGNLLYIKAKDLTKHGLIVGVTGAGKTNTCFTILERAVEANIPFMVIESAKSEYRSLLKSPIFKNLHVFTVGDESISPLRLNPFEVPNGILLQSHIDYLQALFGAAFVLYPPMPYVLAMSIQQTYEDKGWDLTANVNLRGRDSSRVFPTIDDLIATVPRVSDSLGYVGETRQNIKSSLEGRLTQLRIGGGKGAMLNCRKSISAEDLFSSSCIIELKQLVNDADKAFLIGLLLIRLCEYYEGKKAPNNGDLRHITLIEEAHRLLRNVSTNQNGDTANPLGKAVEVFTNMLAEIRAYGEGIFMAEQIPTKLAPEALKNTNLKIIQRLVAQDDKDAVGATMGLDDEQKAYLTRLKTGEAVAYMEGLEKSVLIKIPPSKAKENVFIEEDKIREAMQPFWTSRPELLNTIAVCRNCEKNTSCTGSTFISDTKVIHAADTLINSLIYSGKENISLAYKKEFLNCFTQFQCISNAVIKPECFFMLFAQQHAEKIADSYNWPHRKVEILAEKTKDLAYKFIVSPGESVPHEVYALWSDAFNLNRIPANADEEASFVRPLPACSYCVGACRFRPLFSDSIDERLLRSFVKKNGELDVGVALKTAEKKVGNFNTSLLKDASYCVCAHLVDLMDLGYSEKITHGRQLKKEINKVDFLIDNLCCAAEQYISAIMFQGHSMIKYTGEKYCNLSRNKLIITLLGGRFNAFSYALGVLQQRIIKYAKYFSWSEDQQKQLLETSTPVIEHFCDSEPVAISTAKVQNLWKSIFSSSTNFEKSFEFSAAEYEVWRFIPLMDQNFLSNVPQELLQSPPESVLRKILTFAERKIARTTKNRELISSVLAIFPQKGKNSIEHHSLAKQLDTLLK